MAKLTLSNILSKFASITTLNANFDAIETAMENTLSRDGTTPNSMGADLDMNSNRILNLPNASQDQEPVTLAQTKNSSLFNKIINGSGAPTDGDGIDGDFYLDTTGNDIWGPKAAGTWTGTGPTSLIGPTGPTGPTGPQGDDGLFSGSEATVTPASDDLVPVKDTSDSANPKFVTAQTLAELGGGGAIYSPGPTGGNNSAGNAHRGNIFIAREDITITSLVGTIDPNVASAQYRGYAMILNGSNVVQSIQKSSIVTLSDIFSLNQKFDLTSPLTVTSGDRVCVMVGRTNGVGTDPANLSFTSAVWGNYGFSNGGVNAIAEMQVTDINTSDTISTTANLGAFGIGIYFQR